MRPKLGQHFLVKGAILERIAAAACPSRENLVIEIGPGRGALTERLLQRADRVVAVEVDPYLVAHLRARFAGDPRLQVVHADVLEAGLAQWGRAPVVGNLPYYITSPILEMTAALDLPRAVFLIQKEVADRLVARPGTRDYGFLTVRMAVFAETRLCFQVKPSAFHPPPKVDSAVVLLQPRRLDLDIADPTRFLEFVGHCFRHKRKTLRNNLAEVYGKDRVEAWPEGKLRAEQLSLGQFADLFRRLAQPE
ncbi:MAG: 16S rRNA (adenine(1518)-N(6)/adenine(1519)-N(6))-dimethyltransferase RsmA [Acidobacteriia bacterium]|nr:16S rRNA (adenine(1518)-N(6)/adenine(1519)-N(6))-dimethyltransferase RsmA [Terriglobia bacterium]